MKVFVSVGAQIPFDRLVRAVDVWVAMEPSVHGFAQIGPKGYKPENMDWAEFLNPDDYREKVQHSDILIAHAGMGSIITALQYRKPIVILPRRAKLAETRNDHQVGTANRFANHDGVYSAFEDSDLPRLLASVKLDSDFNSISKYASNELIEKIKRYINS